jgi:hypothetical protein
VANVIRILNEAVSPVFTAQNSPSTPTDQNDKGKQCKLLEEAITTKAQQRVNDFWPPMPEVTEDMFQQQPNPPKRRTSLPTTDELQRLKREIARARAAIAESCASLSPQETIKSEPRAIPQLITRHELLPSESKTLTWALLTRNQFGAMTAPIPKQIPMPPGGLPPLVPPVGPLPQFPQNLNPIGWDNKPLQGQKPSTFDGNQQKTDEFLHELRLYQFVNTTHPIMMNLWWKVAHTLTYVDGPEIYEWKRSAENWILSIPAPSAPNKTVYKDFEEEFIKLWTDTNEPHHAATELDKLQMKNKNVDEYITIFAELARKALYHKDDPAVLEKFKSGLPLELLEPCMHHDDPQNWDAWTRSTRVRQAILTSLKAH